MRSFANIIATLLLLVVLALAQDATQVQTHYTTRTVYRVVTETQTGTPPASTAAIVPTHGSNATSIVPTHSVPSISLGPTPPAQPSTGAASSFQVPVGAAAAVLLGMLAL